MRRKLQKKRKKMAYFSRHLHAHYPVMERDVLIPKTLHRPFGSQTLEERSIGKWVAHVLLKPITIGDPSFFEVIVELPITLISRRPGGEPEYHNFPCHAQGLSHYSRSMLWGYMLKNVRYHDRRKRRIAERKVGCGAANRKHGLLGRPREIYITPYEGVFVVRGKAKRPRPYFQEHLTSSHPALENA